MAPKKKNPAATALVNRRWEKTTKEQRLKVGEDLKKARERARARRKK